MTSRLHTLQKDSRSVPALLVVRVLIDSVAQAEPPFAEHEGDSAPRRHAYKSKTGERAAKLRKSVHSFLPKQHGHGNKRINHDHVARLDADNEEQKELRVAIEEP